MTTLERAARALAEADPQGRGVQYWRDYVPDARAVLTAIREPSEGMLEAGLDKARECTDNWQSVAACLPGHCWTAMIDAALGEG